MITYRHIVFALVTIFAILTQLVNPTLAHADGEVPPTPPAEAATEAAPTDIPIATEVPTQPDVLGMDATLTELPAVTEVSASASPTIDPVAPDIPAADISTAEEPTPLEIIEQIPAQTDIVVLNATGESIPLATQQAAEIIAEGDPMWCPAGATIVTVNCVNAATVGELLPLLASKDEDGIIYFYTPTTYSTNDVTFNGTNANIDQLANNSLTLQGGWIGITNLGSEITFTGNSFFSVPILITHWIGTVSVNDIAVNGAAGTGLTVATTGNINLDNITASNNSGLGSSINNTSSLSNATVKLTGTNIFSGNYNTGLSVFSNGNISASNVTANSNGLDGAYLRTVGNVTIANSVFSGNQTFPKSGLAVFNAANVIITNNVFSENGYGMYLYNIDNVTLSDNVSINNKIDGAYISAWGNVAITNNIFNGNTINPYSGLAVFNAFSVDAIGNTFNENYYGLYLKNVWNIFAVDNIFAGNRKYGLAVTNGSSVYLSNNDAIYNCAGVYLNTSATTIIDGGSISNNVSGIVKINDASLFYLNGVTVSRNGNDVTNVGIECETAPEADPDPDPTPISATILTINISNFDQANGVAAPTEFAIDCIHRQRYIVNLPNGDQVQVFCPVSGKAHISRLDNTALPADLPAGYTYTSAFSLDILRGEKPISVINEGGYIKVSFNIPSLEAGTTYSVLYWDNGRWTPLKDFMTDENGNPRGFNLHADDPRKILSGSNFIFEEGSPTRLEISTNFPGTFVLAQH